jgi:hypothetical protein
MDDVSGCSKDVPCVWAEAAHRIPIRSPSFWGVDENESPELALEDRRRNPGLCPRVRDTGAGPHATDATCSRAISQQRKLEKQTTCCLAISDSHFTVINLHRRHCNGTGEFTFEAQESLILRDAQQGSLVSVLLLIDRVSMAHIEHPVLVGLDRWNALCPVRRFCSAAAPVIPSRPASGRLPKSPALLG